MIRLEFEGNRAQPGVGVRVSTRRRMWRAWACGSSQGTRQGFFRTRVPADRLAGINWRRGQFLALIHTRRRNRETN